MRENRTYGSEGGAAEVNRSFLPLSLTIARRGSPDYCCERLWSG